MTTVGQPSRQQIAQQGLAIAAPLETELSEHRAADLQSKAKDAAGSDQRTTRAEFHTKAREMGSTLTDQQLNAIFYDAGASDGVPGEETLGLNQTATALGQVEDAEPKPSLIQYANARISE